MKAELSRLIPRKPTEHLELVLVADRCYQSSNAVSDTQQDIF